MMKEVALSTAPSEWDRFLGIVIITIFILIVHSCWPKCKKHLLSATHTNAMVDNDEHNNVDDPTAYHDPSPTHSSSFPLMCSSNNKRVFTYEELERATDGFSEVNFIAKGGFGLVYKGVLSDGQKVAVKKLRPDRTCSQSDHDFQVEVEVLIRVHHRHLVSLVGYCITEADRLLAYEFVPNNTLEFNLHKEPKLDWSSRLMISVELAIAIEYLHDYCDPRIIHRDIKAANVLLDFNMNVKVADFGLAKSFPDDVNTPVTTKIAGTCGYVDPEYCATGQLSEKSDVYSFGVILLELITGKESIMKTGQIGHDINLVEWARPLLARCIKENDYSELVDKRIRRTCDSSQMGAMIACADACVRHVPTQRPHMRQVVRALQGGPLDDLNNGVLIQKRRRRRWLSRIIDFC